jgi:hypothetical protein
MSELRNIKGELPRADQETSMSWLAPDKEVEITTAEHKWQRRIESLGIEPAIINQFEDGNSSRVYYVPKNFIKLPSSGRRINKVAVKKTN